MKSIPALRPTSSYTGTNRLVKVAVMLLLPLLIVAIVACDNGSASSSGGNTATATRAAYEGVPEGKPVDAALRVPDPKEVTEKVASGKLPSFLASMAPADQERLGALYKGAVDHADAYSHIPCYCGCAIYTTAHKSLSSCYIKDMAAGGDVTFTDHSLTCDLCQSAAQMTLDSIARKTPLKDVRASIFQKLKYTGIWTDTPPVP